MAEHFIHSDPFTGRITAVKLHRLALLPLEMIAYQSLCNKLWTIYHVDYVAICRLNAKNYAKAGDLFLYSLILLAVWTCSFLYSIIGIESIFLPIIYTPLVLYVFLLVNLFQPFNCALPYTRRWLQIRLGKWLTIPCRSPTFIDSYFSDYLTSLHQVFMDLIFLVQVYITKGNLIANHEGFYLTMQGTAMCLPEWVRAIQCLRFYNITGDPRQLLNTVKYLIITSVAISKSFLIYNQHHSTTYFINPFFTIWLCCVLFRSTLCCYWDLIADSGLFAYNHLGQFTLLREVILYPKQFYYFFIFENIILRYFWITHIIAHKTGFISPTVLEWFGPVAEVFRRFVWSLIRIEKKSVDIILGLRALHDVELDVPTEHYSQALKRLQSSMRFNYERTKNKIVPLIVNHTSFFRRSFRDESPTNQYKSVNHAMPFMNNHFDEDDDESDDGDDEDILYPQKTWIPSPVLNPLWIQEI